MRDRRKVENGEEKIGIEKIREIIGRMKNGKAAGMDGIPEEVWKYGEKELERWAGEFCNKVWESEGWPEGRRG